MAYQYTESASTDSECIPSSEAMNTFHCFKRTTREETNSNTYKCQDAEERCSQWAQAGECRKNPQYMQLECRKSCGTCVPLHIGYTQTASDRRVAEKVLRRLVHTQNHVHQQAQRNFKALEKCKNEHASCTMWAVEGRCREDAQVQARCSAACFMC